MLHLNWLATCRSVPDYNLDSYSAGLRVVEAVNSPQVRQQQCGRAESSAVCRYGCSSTCSTCSSWRATSPAVSSASSPSPPTSRSPRQVSPRAAGNATALQVPERGEPDSPGELDYGYIFSQLERLGYTGWVGLSSANQGRTLRTGLLQVGLEYKPRAATLPGLAWLQKLGFRL